MGTAIIVMDTGIIPTPTIPIVDTGIIAIIDINTASNLEPSREAARASESTAAHPSRWDRLVKLSGEFLPRVVTG
jgi:hypothetical protein